MVDISEWIKWVGGDESPGCTQELPSAGTHSRGSSEIWAVLRSRMDEHTLIKKQQLWHAASPCFWVVFPSSGNRLELKYRRWGKAEVRECKMPELWEDAGVQCREGCSITTKCMKLMWEKRGVSRRATGCIFQHAYRVLHLLSSAFLPEGTILCTFFWTLFLLLLFCLNSDLIFSVLLLHKINHGEQITVSKCFKD